tara:strand:- start:196 stop:1146 length:951 start_codon:yes stop_codon:yes gene_type:complete
MNHILIVIGFLFLLFVLNESKTKENFSQLILPNYNNTIFTGKSQLENNTVIVKENSERKPSPVEDVKQPPYSRFTGGDDTISDSPEDIKEIDSRLDELVSELDVFADTNINLGNSALNNQAICGEEEKKLSPANFKTPWRRDNKNDKTMKLLERYIIQKFAPSYCLWGLSGDTYSQRTVSLMQGGGCGILQPECEDNYKNNPLNSDNDVWSSLRYDNKGATNNLILDCTGYNPSGGMDDNYNLAEDFDQIEEPPCKRLCCNNLLFPINQGSKNPTSGDIQIYKKYLKYLYEESQLNNTSVPYIEDSLSGVYTSNIY